MLQLATEESEDIRARARAESEVTTADAAARAERTITEAEQQRDAIQREIDELSTLREQLLQRLIELGGEVVGATERFRGFPPGTVPAPTAPVRALRRGGRRSHGRRADRPGRGNRCGSDRRRRGDGERGAGQRDLNTIGNVSSDRIAGVYTSSWPSFTAYSGMRRCHSRSAHAQLEARQVRAEAPVHAAAERVVRVHLAVEAHLVGVGQRGLVGVDRAEADAHHVALADRAAEELGVLGGDAHDAADRRLPAQQLLHRRRHERRVGDELGPLLGVLAQVAEEAVERRAHGVEAGDEEEEADVEDVLAGEAVAVDLGVEEPAQQVAPALDLALVELPVEVVVDRLPGRVLVGERLLRGRAACRRRGRAG